jgi:DNA-binding NarL/FixJ family response regulator
MLMDQPVARRQHTNSGGRGSVSKQRVVCLLSANPLALSELERLVRRVRGLKVKRTLLDLDSFLSSREISVPPASAYVLDSWSTVASSEALVSAIYTRRPNTRLILLTNRISEAASFAFLQLGVKGFVTHKHLADELPRAVVSVVSGGLWIPRTVLSKFLAYTLASARAPERARSTPDSPRISHRERQVLDCVMKSQSNKEISAELHISESTVKFHLARLFEKFGVRRRSDLILQTVQQTAAVVH